MTVDGEFDAYDDMHTFPDNLLLGQSDENMPTQQSNEFSAAVDTQYKGIFYVTMAVGIPCNVLSAIVWLRHCTAYKSSSAVYLAALAVIDVVYLLSTFVYISGAISTEQLGWYDCACYLAMSSATLEPLLVLSFSVERLIAILHPLKAKALCRHGTAAKVVAGLTVLSLTAQAIRFILMYFYDTPLNHTVGVYGIVLLVIVPITVLVINAVVVREVRRAAHFATTNLGQQHHQQSTSANSAVPTVMLLSASFIYVLLSGPHCLLSVVYFWMPGVVSYRAYLVAWALMQPIYAYNFFVYIITGSRFRIELCQLFSCCCCDVNTFSRASASETVMNDTVPQTDDTRAVVTRV